MAKAGPLGLAMQVAGLCYCARRLTDGDIPAQIVPQLLAVPRAQAVRLAETLVECGVWERRGPDYYVHDYLEYNPSREQVEAKRAAKHESRVRSGRLGGQRSGEARHAARPSKTEANDQAKAKQNEAQALLKQNEPPTPSPSPTPQKRSDQTDIAREGPRLLAPKLTSAQSGALEALHEQVQRLVFAGSDAPPNGWCEDLIKRGATLTDIDHAVQAAVSRGKRSTAYVRAALEGRVRDREAGRDPDAERAHGSPTLEAFRGNTGAARSRAMAAPGGRAPVPQREPDELTPEQISETLSRLRPAPAVPGWTG